MERSADWMDQARGDAERLVRYAADLLHFCEDLLPTL